MVLENPKIPKPKQPMDRIAFAGPMCVGKTTLADVLCSNFDYRKMAFASKLKSIAYSLYGISGKDNYSRKVLQELADDLKKWDRDLFVTHLLIDVEKSIKNGFDKIVVDDVRFPSEADSLRSNGFSIICVTCDEEERQNRILKLYPDTDTSRADHPSEKGWNFIKYNSTIDSTSEIAFYDLLDLIEDGNKNRFRGKK